MIKRRRPQWHFGVSAVLLLGALAFTFLLAWQQPRDGAEPLSATLPSPILVEPSGDSTQLHDKVDTTLAELGLWPDLIAKDRRDISGVEFCTVDVRVPNDLPLATVNLALHRLVRSEGGHVFRAVEHPPGMVRMECGFDSLRTTLFRLHLKPRLERRAGNIAVVLGNFGRVSWPGGLAERFFAIRQRLTLSVPPEESSAAEIASLARRNGHEVLLHLPMERRDPVAGPERNGLAADGAEAIRERVHRALARVPNAVGVNTHLGPRSGADFPVMRELLKVLQKRGLLFLDSRSAEESLDVAMASALGVPVAQRDLFIDAEGDSVRAIEIKLWELAEIARRKGQAIGIGQDSEATLLALESTLPQLESRGFRVVPVSQLVQ
jgi:polysaccharide deacetylase 2 family uncharacterized protein YibQ